MPMTWPFPSHNHHQKKDKTSAMTGLKIYKRKAEIMENNTTTKCTRPIYTAEGKPLNLVDFFLFLCAVRLMSRMAVAQTEMLKPGLEKLGKAFDLLEQNSSIQRDQDNKTQGQGMRARERERERGQERERER